MSARKWRIEKRRDKDSAYSIDMWPWRLHYPGGGTCLCFSFKNAVACIKDAQRALHSANGAFMQLELKYRAGYFL